MTAPPGSPPKTYTVEAPWTDDQIGRPLGPAAIVHVWLDVTQGEHDELMAALQESEAPPVEVVQVVIGDPDELRWDDTRGGEYYG